MIVSSQKGLHTSVERAAFLQQKRNNLPLMCQSVSDISPTDKFAISASLNVRNMGEFKYDPTEVYSTAPGVNLTYPVLEEVSGGIGVMGISSSRYYYCYFNGATWQTVDTGLFAVAGVRASLKVIKGVVSAAILSGTSVVYWQYEGVGVGTYTIIASKVATTTLECISLCEVNGNPFIVYSDINPSTTTTVKSIYFDGFSWIQSNVIVMSDDVSVRVKDINIIEIDGIPQICFSAVQNAGAAFTARDSDRNWRSVASSSDGTKLVACVLAGQIYTSTDSGASWTARGSSANWYSVASSSDGTKLVACVYGGQIYTSTDSGANWSPRDSTRNWRSVASSSDGTKLVACVDGGQIYTSTDSGVSWFSRDSARAWASVASSSDGTKLVACVFGGRIYTSTDSGVNWSFRDSSRNWLSVTSSSDGTKLAACVSGGQIYTSTDSGVNWTARGSSANWYSVASSSDGTKLAACVNSGYVYVSADSGLSWDLRDSSRSWYSVALSSDGEDLIACVYGEKIYTSDLRNGYIKYASFNWTSWAVDTVSSKISSAVMFASMAEKDGMPIITFGNDADDCLYYATTDGFTWSEQNIGSNIVSNRLYLAQVLGDVYIVAETSVDVRIYASNGAYFDYFTAFSLVGGESIFVNNNLYFFHSAQLRKVKLSKKNYVNSGTLDAISSPSCSATINGQPAIAYSFGSVLKYSHFDGTSWVNETVGGGTTNVSYISLCDVYGFPAIAYYNAGLGSVQLAKYDGGSWNIETVDAAGGSYCCASFIYGQPAVAYYRGGVLYVALYNGSSWDIHAVELSVTASVLSLAEVYGNAAVVYVKSGQLYYSSYNGISWTAIAVMTPGVLYSLSLKEISGYPSIALVSSGILQYYRYNGVAWTGSVLYSANNTMCSLKVIGNYPSIVYTYTTSGRTNTYLATLDEEWYTRKVNSYDATVAVATDNTQELELFTVSADSSGSSLSMLDYLREPFSTNKSSADVITTDTTQCSLSVITSQPAIASASKSGSSYYLYYVRYNGSSWSPVTVVDPTAATITWITLKEVGGSPAIAYLFNGFTRYASYSGSWGTVAFDATAASSLSFDVVNGQPALLRRVSPNKLQYTRYNGASWPAFADVVMSVYPSGGASLKGINNLAAAAFIPSSGFPAYRPNVLVSTSETISSYIAFSGSNIKLEEVNENPVVAYDSVYGIIYCERINGVWYPEITGISNGKVDILDISGKAAIFTGNTLYIRECSGFWTSYPQAYSTLNVCSAIVDSNIVSFAYTAGTAGAKKLKYATISFVSHDSYSNVFSKGDSYGLSYKNCENNSLIFTMRQSDNTEKTLTYKVSDRNFNSYAFIGYDGYVNLYVNGSYVSNIAYDNTVKQNSQALKIGAGGANIDFLIDDLTVWKNVDFTFNSMDSFASYIHNSGSGRRFEDVRAHWVPPVTVDTAPPGTIGQYCYIASVGGVPAISYYDSSNTNLKYAKKVGGSWTTETVDSSGALGRFTSLTEFAGKAWISYYADTNGASSGDLKVARYVGPGWTIYTVDSGGFVGQYSSISVIGSYPAVSYYDVTNGNLNYVTWNGSSWDSPTVVDSTGNVGLYSSLCEIFGNAAIAYYDATNKKLKYAYYNSGWFIETVDSSADCGKFASLTVKDAGATPIVCYYDSDNQKLKYAVRNGVDDWTVSTIDAGPHVGQYCQMVVIDNKEIVVYYDAVNFKPKYLRYNGTAWVPERFYGTEQFGTYCRVANVGDKPHIAAFSSTSQSLRYIEPSKHIFDF